MDGILQYAIKTTAFITMILVGTDCAVEGLRMTLKRPGVMVTVGIGQFLFVPIIIYLSCLTLGASAKVTAGLMLFSCCPAGIISNTYCYLIDGNTSLSVSLTAISNVAALLLTPLALFAVYALLGDETIRLQPIPAEFVIRELLVMMLVPILIGAWIRARRPLWIASNKPYLRRFAMIPTLILLVLIISNGFEAIVSHIREIFLITVLSTLLLLAAGLAISHIYQVYDADRWAILLELPCRNLAIAAIIGIVILGWPELVGFAVAFFVLQAIMILTLIWTVTSRRKRRGQV